MAVVSRLFTAAWFLPFVASAGALVWAVVLRIRARRGASKRQASPELTPTLQAFVEAGVLLWFVSSAAWMLANVFAEMKGPGVAVLLPAANLAVIGFGVLVLTPALVGVPSLLQRTLEPPDAVLRSRRMLAGRVYGWWNVGLGATWLVGFGLAYLLGK